jgi:hypothetical protein
MMLKIVAQLPEGETAEQACAACGLGKQLCHGAQLGLNMAGHRARSVLDQVY